MLHKWFVRITLTLFFLQMFVPIVGLVIFTLNASGHVSLTVYGSLFSDQEFEGALVNSVLISLVSVVLSVFLLTPSVWYAYLHHPRLLRVLEGLSFISFVLPAVVLGLGYVQFFSDGPLPLAGTPDLLPFAFTLLAMPYYIQSVLNRLRMVDAKTFHDAARSLGGSTWVSLMRVQLPVLKSGILNGSVLVFTIGMGEFTITQLTTGGSYMTLPIYLQAMFAQNPVQGSAMAVFGLVVSALLVFIALGALGRARRVKA